MHLIRCVTPWLWCLFHGFSMLRCPSLGMMNTTTEAYVYPFYDPFQALHTPFQKAPTIILLLSCGSKFLRTQSRHTHELHHL